MSVTAAIMAGAAALTAATSTGSAIAQGKLNRKNRKWQEKMYKQQVADRRADAEMQFNRQKELADWAYRNYDSPAAQRAANAAAGINPFVEGSAIQPAQVNPGSAQAAQGGDVPGSGPYQNNPMSALQSGASSLFEVAQMRKQFESIDADIALKDAQRVKTLAEAQGQVNENSLFEFAKSAAESDALSKRFRVELDKVNAEFAQAFAEADLTQRKALLQEIWSRVKSNLAQAARTDADRLTIDTLRNLQAKSLGAGVSLTEAQTSATQAQTSLTQAEVDYKRMLTKVEDSKLEPTLREIQSRINNLDKSSLSLEQRRILDFYETEIRAALANHEKGAMREFLRKVETTGTSLWRFILPTIGGK